MGFKVVVYLLVCAFGLLAVQADDLPRVQLDNQGVLEGRVMETMGNLGVEPKPYYSFRNIPYAHTSKETRFAQPVPATESLGNTSVPYNAGPTGPLCPQGGLQQAAIDDLVGIPIKDTLTGIVKTVMDALDIPGSIVAAPVVAEAILGAMEKFFELPEITRKMTVGDLLESWLDVSLSVQEDCLHLAVYTPVNPSTPELKSELPVMFFIHGGGFEGGTQIQMDAARLGDVANVIVVSINYRVGPIGFMCLNTDEAAGNMGLLDMTMALQWVQDNIGKFGGDPNQVTIFGESAGAAAIGHLVLSNTTENLFARGIGQSGSAVSPWAFDTEPEYHAKSIAAKLSCDRDNQTDIVTCLRNLDIEDILNAYSEHASEERKAGELGFGGTSPCGQKAGVKKFFTEFQNPTDLLIKGEYRDLPVFFGANSHEGSFIMTVVYSDYLVPNDLVEDTEYFSYLYLLDLLHMLKVDQGNALNTVLEDIYWQKSEIGSMQLMTPGLVDFTGAFFIKASTYRMVEENSKRSDSFFYSVEHASRKSLFNIFNLGGETPYLQDRGLPGVCHADELMHLFNVPIPIVLCDLTDFVVGLVDAALDCRDQDQGLMCFAESNSTYKAEWRDCLFGELTEEEQVWSNNIVKAWTNFAEHGTPTPPEETEIPTLDKFDLSSPSYLAFRPEGPVVVKQSYAHTFPLSATNDDTSTTTSPTTSTTDSTDEQCDCGSGTSVTATVAGIAIATLLAMAL